MAAIRGNGAVLPCNFPLPPFFANSVNQRGLFGGETRGVGAEGVVRGGNGNENMIYAVLGQLFGSEGERGRDIAHTKGSK